MALNQIDVFEKTIYGSATDILKENVAVFNQNSNGAIRLSNMSIVGDFAQQLDLMLGESIIKSRNPYANTELTAKEFTRVKDNVVKLAFGTHPVTWTNAEFNWVKQNPELAGVKIGRKLANDVMQTMAEFAIGSVATALASNTAVKTVVENATPLSHNHFVQALAPMGDQFNTIALYVIHSKTYFQLLETTFKNAERLWDFGNYAVMRTAIGQHFLITDNKGLLNASTSVYSLGLKPNSVVVGTEADFDQHTEKHGGKENLYYTYQAEWTSGLKIANRRYKTADGMNGLTYANVTTASNWEKISNNVKDETGVVIEKKLA